MRVVLQRIREGNEEVVIKYKEMTKQIDGIVKYIESQAEKLMGMKDDKQFVINIYDAIYLESVDGITYLYTDTEIYKLNITLLIFESMYAERGFFRCSKSMILNIYRISSLKSMSGNRINATMDNGEHVIISRRYAKELRTILKEGNY